MNVQILVALVLFMALCLLGISILGSRRLDRRYPPSGKSMKVGQARIHYNDSGEGATVVCLHGASSNARDLEESIVPLLTGDFRVVTMDRPGLGHSTRPGAGWWSPLDQASAVREVLHRLDIRNPILLGHSWSGAVVLSYLLHYPGEALGGILLSPATRDWNRPPTLYYRISRWPLVGNLFVRLLVFPVGSLAMGAGVRFVFHRGRAPRDYRRRTQLDLLLRPDTWRANADDLCHLGDYLKETSEDYGRIRHPLLAIIGDHDRVVSNEIHTLALKKQIPHLQIVCIAQSGHLPHHENPQAVARLIRRFCMDVKLPVTD